ncbi:auxin response factor 6 [Selaginella moellendorffii]|nr:auxin response factor 6 [Selaginella moellendorffii]|eukprot:XP_002966547.2 auxin response factor 6 [Selaginella moellendorffii]
MSFVEQPAGKGFAEAAGVAAAAAGGGGIAPGGGAVVRDEASCIVQESSGDSGSTLKAHDYIGLSEVTSMPLKPDSGSKPLPDLNLGETELRLGPPKSKEPAKNNVAAGEAPKWQHEKVEQPKSEKSNEPDLSGGNVFWQAAARMIPQEVQAPSPAAHQEMSHTAYCNVASTAAMAANKNKRVFSEAIGSNGQFVEGRSVMPNPPGIVVAGSPSNPGTGNGGASSSNPGVPVAPAPSQPSNGKASATAPPLMPSSMYPWNSSKQLPAAWRMGLEQSKSSFGPFPSSSRMAPKMGDVDNNNSNSGSPNSSGLTSHNKEDATEEAVPSASPPVVGWPPVQSFRKNLVAHPPPPQHKSTETTTKNGVSSNTSAPAPAPAAANAATASPLFVKVYMDGVPIGRKVDLKANNSYDKLSTVLEDMFLRFITGQNGTPEVSSIRDPGEKKLNFLQSSDFVLTYEDKDGDLMLVGDVPWGMFTGTVKRLRIMKGSEAIGLAPRDKAQA